MRSVFFFLTFISFFGISFLLCLFNDKSIEEIILISFINLVFITIYLVSITGLRLRGRVYSGTNYFLFLICFLLCFLCIFLQGLFPDYYFPLGILPIILSASFPVSLAMSGVCFFTILSSVLYYYSYSTIYGYFLIGFIICLIGEYYKESGFKNRVLVILLTSLVQFVTTCVFQYFLYFDLTHNMLILFLISSIISGIFMGLGYNLISGVFSKERHISYETILDEKYPILQDIRSISLVEYNHAVSVANISGSCAGIIGADVLVCMAGGLYYHGGNYDSNIDDEGFLRRLQNRCFPPEVIKLISEKGINNLLPSSKEAAIVHMTDSLVTKFEAIYKKADKSDWNTNMVVYQTLNEYSSNGIYDKCGLSMNEFLKIRDFLANQEF